MDRYSHASMLPPREDAIADAWRRYRDATAGLDSAAYETVEPEAWSELQHELETIERLAPTGSR